MKPHFDQLFKPNVSLADLTTFRIGGPARAFYTATTAKQCIAAVRAAIDAAVPWRVIGAGSNILATDDPIDRAIIAFIDRTHPARDDDGVVTVSGGTTLGDLVTFCAEQGLTGVENLAGIPGTVAGAVVGNAGAYGTCIADPLTAVRVLSREGEIRTVAKNDLKFEYRWSRLKKIGDVVLEVTFHLQRGDGGSIQAEIDRVMDDRRSKHPDYITHPTAGSFFKNLSPAPGETRRQAAGKFLEDVGAKELRVGDAGPWHDHANIVVNYGAATARDVKNLTRTMACRVFEHFGITLEPEVTFLD